MSQTFSQNHNRASDFSVALILINEEIEIIAILLISVTPHIDHVLSSAARVCGSELNPQTNGEVSECLRETRGSDVVI